MYYLIYTRQEIINTVGTRILELCTKRRNYVFATWLSFSIFFKLYFVYKVQGSSDQFFIFVIVTRDMIMPTTEIVTVFVGR